MFKDFSKDLFDIIILAGQSNAEGWALGEVDRPYTPTSLVWCINNDSRVSGEFTITVAKERVVKNEVVSNFGLTFAEEYIKNGRLAEERKVLIVNATVGNTGFVDGRWGMNDDLYLRMLDMIDTVLQ